MGRGVVSGGGGGVEQHIPEMSRRLELVHLLHLRFSRKKLKVIKIQKETYSYDPRLTVVFNIVLFVRRADGLR